MKNRCEVQNNDFWRKRYIITNKKRSLTINPAIFDLIKCKSVYPETKYRYYKIWKLKSGSSNVYIYKSSVFTHLNGCVCVWLYESEWICASQINLISLGHMDSVFWLVLVDSGLVSLLPCLSHFVVQVCVCDVWLMMMMMLVVVLVLEEGTLQFRVHRDIINGCVVSVCWLVHICPSMCYVVLSRKRG